MCCLHLLIELRDYIFKHFFPVIIKIRQVQPAHAAFSFKPGKLALCKMSCITLQNMDGLLKAVQTIQIIHNLFIAKSLHGYHLSGAAHGPERFHLFYQSVPDHLIHAAVNPFIKNRPVGIYDIIEKLIG